MTSGQRNSWEGLDLPAGVLLLTGSHRVRDNSQEGLDMPAGVLLLTG